MRPVLLSQPLVLQLVLWRLAVLSVGYRDLGNASTRNFGRTVAVPGYLLTYLSFFTRQSSRLVQQLLVIFAGLKLSLPSLIVSIESSSQISRTAQLRASKAAFVKWTAHNSARPGEGFCSSAHCTSLRGFCVFTQEARQAIGSLK